MTAKKAVSARKRTPATSSPEDARLKAREYVANLPPDARRHLIRLRTLILAVAPAAVEGFSYGVPSYRLNGQPLVWYAAFKQHVSLYPMTATIRRTFASELKGLKTSTGTIQFPIATPLPTALIKRLVKARIAEVKARVTGERRQ